MGPLMRNAGGRAIVAEPARDTTVEHRERLLLEVALLQQFVPASEDLQEHLVDHLLGDPPAAGVDLREVVEELLVTQVEGLEVEGQFGRGLDGLAVAAVLGRYVSADVAVAHTVLQEMRAPASSLRPAVSCASQLAHAKDQVLRPLRHHPVVFRGSKLMRPSKIVTLRSSP